MIQFFLKYFRDLQRNHTKTKTAKALMAESFKPHKLPFAAYSVEPNKTIQHKTNKTHFINQ